MPRARSQWVVFGALFCASPVSPTESSRRAAVALAFTALLTAWLLVDGAAAVIDSTDTLRFGSLQAASPSPLGARGRVVRLDYRSPALGQRAMVAWVYVPAASPRARLPVALFLHGIPGAPDDWLAGADLASALDRAVANGSFPPALAVVPDGEGMHNPRAGWSDVAHQHLLTGVSRDLLAAVARHWSVDLGPGRVAVIGVGRGGVGAARLARRDVRVGVVAALDPPAPLQTRPQIRLLIERSTDSGPVPGSNWQRWRNELPGVLDWVGRSGFGAPPGGTAQGL